MPRGKASELCKLSDRLSAIGVTKSDISAATSRFSPNRDWEDLSDDDRQALRRKAYLWLEDKARRRREKTLEQAGDSIIVGDRMTASSAHSTSENDESRHSRPSKSRCRRFSIFPADTGGLYAIGAQELTWDDALKVKEFIDRL